MTSALPPSTFKIGFAALVILACASPSTPAATPDLVAPQVEAEAPAPIPASPLAPALSDRDQRLSEKGLAAGSPVMIRIFKTEAELELWVKKDGQFEHFATYPICYFSGGLGPKLREGDRQSPEGLYTVSADQLRRRGRWPRSLDIGYPNLLDQANKRTGSAILVHGGCNSIGCYAMTTPIMEEIFSLSDEAIKGGQQEIPVHVFPFRMTEANLTAHAGDPWREFWDNLKQAYDLFELTRIPPHVSVCRSRYVVRDGSISASSELAPPPRRMVRLARLMRGELPVKQGECAGASAGPSPEDVAALARHQRPAALMMRIARVVQPVRQVRHARQVAGRNVRANYAAARKARVAAVGRRTAARR